MAEKIWLKSYPKGIPATVDLEKVTSIVDLLDHACADFRDRPAFTNMGVTLTYSDLDRLSRDFAAYLQSLPGLKKGERVAIMLPNILQYPIALLGVLRAGMIVVNVNPLYTARELEHQLNDSGARAILVLENFAHTLAEVVDKTKVEHVFTTQLGDMAPVPKRWLINFIVKHVKKMVPPWRLDGSVSFIQTLVRGNPLQLKDPITEPDDVAFLQYTGGTTGVSKGAMLTHRNICANVAQATAWIGAELVPGKEVVITPLPLYHIFSLMANCLLFMRLGGHNILITNPRDMPGFVKELAKYEWTVISGVNTLFNGLLNTDGFKDLHFKHAKFALGGGAAVQQAVADRWRKVTGVRLVEAYGLTESSPGACINPVDGGFNGSIGLPLPSTEISIRDDEGKERALGLAGEIWIRGPQVMKGYWNRPEETANVLTPDGWLKTGDIGTMDEQGYIRITDRKKDMILVSGFNVYPNEIEAVAAQHPGVLESAAIGVTDDKTGEAVKLFVVRKDPNLTAEAMIDYFRSQVTGYKVPRQVEFRNDLPKSPVGKILRRELRDKQPVA